MFEVLFAMCTKMHFTVEVHDEMIYILLLVSVLHLN